MFRVHMSMCLFMSWLLLLVLVLVLVYGGVCVAAIPSFPSLVSGSFFTVLPFPSCLILCTPVQSSSASESARCDHASGSRPRRASQRIRQRNRETEKQSDRETEKQRNQQALHSTPLHSTPLHSTPLRSTKTTTTTRRTRLRERDGRKYTP